MEKCYLGYHQKKLDDTNCFLFFMLMSQRSDVVKNTYPPSPLEHSPCPALQWPVSTTAKSSARAWQLALRGWHRKWPPHRALALCRHRIAPPTNRLLRCSPLRSNRWRQWELADDGSTRKCRLPVTSYNIKGLIQMYRRRYLQKSKSVDFIFIVINSIFTCV